MMLAPYAVEHGSFIFVCCVWFSCHYCSQIRTAASLALVLQCSFPHRMVAVAAATNVHADIEVYQVCIDVVIAIIYNAC